MTLILHGLMHNFRNQNQTVQMLSTLTDWIRFLFQSIPGSFGSIVRETIQNTRYDVRRKNTAMNYAKKARLILVDFPVSACSPVKLQLARESFRLNLTCFANTARLQ
jgi:hypothetical protein